MNKKISVAIDGPAAAGKSTVAKVIARKLSYIYIDTGAMYRALTLKALRHHINIENEEELYQLLLRTTIELKQGEARQTVLLDSVDVTEEIRSQEVTNNVSVVSTHKRIREEMVKRQQSFAANGGVVMDGRDIGTHVLPNAEVKVFLLASVEERALRRHKENLEKGFESNLEQLKKEIERRDQIDSERENAPLRQAKDAVVIDTTSLSIEDVVDRIMMLIKERVE